MAERIDSRQMLRLLKVLARPGGEQQMDGNQFRAGQTGRWHQFELALVQRAVREGLLAPRGNRLLLTAEGTANLRRGLHPEDGHAAQHCEIELRQVAEDGTRLAVNVNESPLARLRQHRGKDGKTWLGEFEFAAGERLRADFERAGLQPRVSANWEASVASGGRGSGLADLNDFALDARRRVNDAVAALEPSLAGVALDVCCFLKGLEQAERERGWPPRSAKLMLRTALSMLARHYGLSGTGQSRAAMRQWGTSDYRPQIGGQIRPPRPAAPRA
jgi:hypothetical protein